MQSLKLEYNILDQNQESRDCWKVK